jgi:3-methyladenine DNA glycosylase AlkD
MSELQSRKILAELEASLVAARQPERAVKVEAYMKNRFPFFGMETQVRRRIQQSYLQALLKITDRQERWDIIRELYTREEREFHYAAIDWLNKWPKKYFTPADIDEFRWLITQHSWWDSVDTIASNALGKWARQFPEQTKHWVAEWLDSDSFWLQRSCLIFQLKYRKETDAQLLEALIQTLKPNKEFFIQKAIGWSLRELSKHKPEAVRAILERQELKGLALREASKYL